MACPIFSLPNEMLDRIFSLLSPDRQTIGACRLVCHSFKNLSSPYLITRVVFARRLKAISHLLEILEHGYFRKYVRELVVDASTYLNHLAMAYEEYAIGCIAESDLMTRDKEWAQGTLDVKKLWSEVDNALNDDQSEDKMSLADCGDNAPVCSGVEDEIEISDDDISEYEYDIDNDICCLGPHQAGALQYWRTSFHYGCHKSFPEYQKLYIAQRKIDAKHTLDSVLLKAFERLPNLKNIVFADWRSMARCNESYVDCARRLFGTTLPPSLTVNDPRDCIELCGKLFCAIEEYDSTGSFEELSIGSLSNQQWSKFYDDDPSCNAVMPMYVPVDAIGMMDHEMVRKLRRLHLRLHVPRDYLQAVPEKPQHDLIRKAVCQALDLEDLAISIDLSHRPDTLVAVRPLLYELWLAEQHFPRLKSIELGEFAFPQDSLQDFLARHALTLRTIRFMDCILLGDRVSLANWAGKTLNLDGIELFRAPAYNPFRDIVEGLVYKGRPVDAHALRSEEEPLWLAGRQNKITR